MTECRCGRYNRRRDSQLCRSGNRTLVQDERVKRFQTFQRQARRKLLLIDAASTLSDLRALPGNRLEALKGDRAGQHSIRINKRWRICFRWSNGKAHDVEIVDYH